MKSTGVVRRIDELGRIVIPKEIRKTLRIKDGENLEIFTEKESIILKKYSTVRSLDDFAQKLTDSIYSLIKKNILILDNESVVAISGELKRKYLDKKISEQMESIISKRKQVVEKQMESINIIDIEEKCYFVYTPIIVNGDAVGLTMILSHTEPITELDEQIVKIVANFLSRHLE